MRQIKGDMEHLLALPDITSVSDQQKSVDIVDQITLLKLRKSQYWDKLLDPVLGNSRVKELIE
jgi:hypothetical protein